MKYQRFAEKFDTLALETTMLKSLPTETSLAEASELLSALANAKRMQVLTLLVKGEMAVGILADAVGLSQSALSQHLAKLREADLVTTRRDAQMIYYSCQSEAVARILKTLEEIFRSDATSSRRVA